MGRPHVVRADDLRPPPIQQRALKKRARIKAAALAVFGELGYEAASLDTIAARGQVAVGTIYQMFRGKRQLLQVLMDELLDRLATIDLSPDPHPKRGRSPVGPRAVVRSILTRALSTDLAYAGVYRAWREAASKDPELARMERSIRAWTSARLHQLFTALRRHATARRDIDVRAFARVMDRVFWSQLPDLARGNDRQLREFIDVMANVITNTLFQDRNPLGDIPETTKRDARYTMS